MGTNRTKTSTFRHNSHDDNRCCSTNTKITEITTLTTIKASRVPSLYVEQYAGGFWFTSNHSLASSNSLAEQESVSRRDESEYMLA
jgi:hypothetical protein